jgi:hypothetical protein
MEKSKQKSNEGDNLIAQPEIDFIVPLQPEDCIQLLQQRHDWSLLAAFTQRIRVDISQLDFDTYEFKVERVSGRGAVAEIVGDLRRWEGTFTRVTADSRISDDMYQYLFVLSILVIGIPFAITNYYLANRARLELIRIIRQSLHVND